MHVDAELLALLALGEQAGTEEERAHTRTCPVCAAALGELQEVVALARGAADLALVEPSPRVWDAIRTEVAQHGAVGLLARARLDPAGPSWSAATGDAEISTDERGRRIVQVTLDAALPSTGVRQAWLVHRTDPSRRQTLGILDGGLGLWTLARELDLEEFSVLDISQQVIGTAEHSGESIVRGRLVPVG